MSSHPAPSHSNGGHGPLIGSRPRLATLFVLLALLWIGIGCAADHPAGDVQYAPAATTIPADEATRIPATGTPASTVVMTATPESDTAPARPAGRANQSGESESRQDQSPERAMTASDFPVPPPRDLWLLAQQMRWQGAEPPATGQPGNDGWRVGDVRDFWTLDYPRRTMVNNRFRLLAISDNAYWWIADAVSVEDEALSDTVAEAEGRVFPWVEAVFASGDEPDRVHVISGRIPGVGGYVSGSDRYPSSVSPYSNEVSAIYINTRAAAYGDAGFLNILAHELQHVIHQEADESEATWLNEGLSELAVTEAGYQARSIYRYLRRPDASLVNWPDHLEADVGLNYGAAALFAHYLREKYAPEGGLQDLLAIQSDGIAAVDEFLTQRGATTAHGQPVDFATVFADWMVANRQDLESGPHGYRNLDVQASITRRQPADDEGPVESLAQYGIDYVEIQDASGHATVHFEGSATTPLLPTEVDGVCWWSNRGDSISATLTRRLTVPAPAADGSQPRLTYRYWHNIEEEWDYLYVSASVDDGETWEVLRATGTTDANPVGNSYGFGYTGASDGWQYGEASLAAYAGRDALVRFHYVTDDAINGPGMCLQAMHVAGDESDAHVNNWVADGFVPVNNRVRQDWIVWVLTDAPESPATRITLRWDAENDRYIGSVPVQTSSDDRLVVAVAPLAPATMESAEYRLWVESGR